MESQDRPPIDRIAEARTDEQARRDTSRWHAVEYAPGVYCIETGPEADPTLIADNLTLIHASIIVAAVNRELGPALDRAALVLYPSADIHEALALVPVVGPDPRD
jgi:hypothetical protein